VGWYVQKTFVIPGDALQLLIRQLHQAKCLIHCRREAALDTPESLRLADYDSPPPQRTSA
jgi:hypothetical protein